MTSLEVSAGRSTNVRQRAEAGSGMTAPNPQRPVLVARLWPGGGLVFDSGQPLSKSADRGPRRFAGPMSNRARCKVTDPRTPTSVDK
jgi:hypothetical protein